MKLRVGAVAMFVAAGGVVLMCPGFISKSNAATPVLYTKSPQLLIPTTTAIGDIAGQSATARLAKATYARTGGSVGGVSAAGSLTVRIFKSERAALASYRASCPGCVKGALRPQKWTYKLRYDNLTQPTRSVTLSALCRNVTVQMIEDGGPNATRAPSPTVLHRQAKLAVWAVFDKAVELGMTQCGTTPKPPPSTGSYYWSESQANTIVRKKVRIPACNVYPDDSGCDKEGGYMLGSVQCRGLDEKPGTFTYSRFSCDVVVYGGRVGGTLAVWPTGPTTLRWEII